MLLFPGRRRTTRLIATSLTLAIVTVAGVTQAAAAAWYQDQTPITGQWAMGGADITNSRWNPYEYQLQPSNVGRLAVKWTSPVAGDVSATPAVVNDAVYFPDWGGYLRKVNARSGQLIWSRKIADYVGIPGAVSRTSPAVVGNTVYIGTQQGARLLAVDTATGDLRWSTALDAHPHAILTQSPVVHKGVVYLGVSSGEEGAAADPSYPCCTFRGSLVATDAVTGRVLWKSYTIPDQGPTIDVFSGAPIWGGTPMIDAATNSVYVATGNNYEIPQSAQDCQDAGGTAAQCLPVWNRINSVLAYDLRTGQLKWSTGQNRFDNWNAGCLPGAPPNNCPPSAGPDWDFGDGVHLFNLRTSDGKQRRAVGVGQKSGEYWMLDAASGAVLWSSVVGPGGAFGGIQWGTATDGQRIYFTESNSNRQPYQLPDGQTIDYSSFGALDPRTGQVLWQVPEPHGAISVAPLSVANGVVYAGSLNGRMYALRAATGQVLWEYQGQGSSNSGPAIVNGSVYWGNGYARWGQGTPSTTFYAFTVPDR
ncbi:outer membrane protein assembly factor BamB family protein [Micromonospora chersina]|uniref:outer membrane protein assembly factor BamB family protein n=1 Tax=Micromonospora chersina TaxID=47854 RepID=UPI00340DA3DB